MSAALPNSGDGPTDGSKPGNRSQSALLPPPSLEIPPPLSLIAIPTDPPSPGGLEDNYGEGKEGNSPSRSLGMPLCLSLPCRSAGQRGKKVRGKGTERKPRKNGFSRDISRLKKKLQWIREIREKIREGRKDDDCSMTSRIGALCDQLGVGKLKEDLKKGT